MENSSSLFRVVMLSIWILYCLVQHKRRLSNSQLMRFYKGQMGWREGLQYSLTAAPNLSPKEPSSAGVYRAQIGIRPPLPTSKPKKEPTISSFLACLSCHRSLIGDSQSTRWRRRKRSVRGRLHASRTVQLLLQNAPKGKSWKKERIKFNSALQWCFPLSFLLQVGLGLYWPSLVIWYSKLSIYVRVYSI